MTVRLSQALICLVALVWACHPLRAQGPNDAGAPAEQPLRIGWSAERVAKLLPQPSGWLRRDGISHVAICPRHRHVAWTTNSILGLWSLDEGKIVAQTTKSLSQANFHEPDLRFSDVGFAQDGQVLLAGTSDGQIRLRSVPDLKHLRTISGSHNRLPFCRSAGQFTISDQRHEFVAPFPDGSLRIWSIPEGLLVATIGERGVMGKPATSARAEPLKPGFVHFTPDGRVLDLRDNEGHSSGGVLVWPRTESSAPPSLSMASAQQFAVSADGQYLAIKEPERVDLYQTTPKLVKKKLTWDDPERVLTGPSVILSDPPRLATAWNSYKPSSSGRQLAETGIEVWSLETGKRLHAWTTTNQAESQYDYGKSERNPFSVLIDGGDGRTLLSATFNGVVAVWNIQEQKALGYMDFAEASRR